MGRRKLTIIINYIEEIYYVTYIRITLHNTVTAVQIVIKIGVSLVDISDKALNIKLI